jgi:hypothetical protein
MSSSTPEAAAACVTLWATATEKGSSALWTEDAVDAGLGDVGLLIDVFKRERGVLLLKQLDDVERLGQDRNEIKPLDLCLGQLCSQFTVVSGQFTVLSLPISVFRDQRPGNSGRS